MPSYLADVLWILKTPPERNIYMWFISSVCLFHFFHLLALLWDSSPEIPSHFFNDSHPKRPGLMQVLEVLEPPMFVLSASITLAPDPLLHHCIISSTADWPGKGAGLGVRRARPTLLERPCEVWFCQEHATPHTRWLWICTFVFFPAAFSKFPEVLQEKDQRKQFR